MTFSNNASSFYIYAFCNSLAKSFYNLNQNSAQQVHVPCFRNNGCPLRNYTLLIELLSFCLIHFIQIFSKPMLGSKESVKRGSESNRFVS